MKKIIYLVLVFITGSFACEKTNLELYYYRVIINGEVWDWARQESEYFNNRRTGNYFISLKKLNERNELRENIIFSNIKTAITKDTIFLKPLDPSSDFSEIPSANFYLI